MRRTALVLAGVLALVAAACSASPAPSASPDTRVTITDATKGELEAVLRQHADALSRKDLNAYTATYDVTRPAFRRCQDDAMQRALRGSMPFAATKIAKVEPYGDGYVRAYVLEAFGYAREYFRRADGRWILTEPKADELGGEKTKTVNGLAISYWGIDDDVFDIYAKRGLDTRDFLTAQQRTQPRDEFALRFFPTRESAGALVACNIAGTSSRAGDPYLRFYSMWFAPSLDDVSDYMKSVLRHEGLHWLQDQFIAGIFSRLDWWLGEGWPDYVAGVERPKRQALCGGASIPTFKQLVDGPPDTADLPPEVGARYYSYGNSMVEYLYATFGKDAYWELMTAYKDSVDPKVTYPKVLKVTPEQYYAGWLAFAKKKYC